MGYWEDRQTEMYKAGEMTVNRYFSELEKAFNRTQKDLQLTINDFYARYADENGLSFADAQKQLEGAETGSLREFIKLSMENIGKYNQTVNNMSVKARITRYRALEVQVDAILRRLYAIDYESVAKRTMSEVYRESYYHTWYGIDRYHGFHACFAQIEPLAVQTLLEYPFNGANFSTRLWRQKEHLQSQLMESLTLMMVHGKNPQVLSDDFSKKMKAKKYDAYRLLHTEGSFLMSEASHSAYREDGVEKYEIVTTLDSKTCGICGKKDGLVVKVADAVVGVNMSPFHCFCRCTDIPYYDEHSLSNETRTARSPGTGYIYEVPADMTYEKWVKKYREGVILNDTTDKWTEEARKELLLDEKALSTRRKETAVVYGPDGSFLFQKRGSEREVSFTRSETDKLKGCVISHNHPSGASLSVRDIMTLRESRAAEMRVTTEGGVYYMRSPKSWPDKIDSDRKIEKQYGIIRNGVRTECQELYQKGKITKTERFQRLVDETNKGFAERFGIEYGKESFED